MKNIVLSVDIIKQLGDFSLQAKFATGSEMLSVLGESGAGKSLLLKCIAGIETPDSGRIILGDKILFDERRQFGFLSLQYQKTTFI